MTSPAPTPVRRSPFRLHVVAGLLAIVAIAGITSACTPELVAKGAIQQYWGKDAACAERIVDRESNFQAGAVNRRSGTTGLFQLHPTHAAWVKKRFGYDFSELKDPMKNAKVARALSYEAARYYGDGWQPWRIGGRKKPGGGCPA